MQRKENWDMYFIIYSNKIIFVFVKDDIKSKVASFPHRQFLLVIAVNSLGSSLMNNIIQWQISSFPCIFSQVLFFF